jgi:hypothetical protein
MEPKAWQTTSWFGRSQHDKQGVFHTIALPYIWFYMQEEKSIIDVIDTFLGSFLTHILNEAKLWIFIIICLFCYGSKSEIHGLAISIQNILIYC